MLIRLAEREPQVDTRLPCLHQKVTSNALIDGSRKPCHLERRERHTHKIVPLTHAEDTRSGANTAPRELGQGAARWIWFLKRKQIGGYRTHQGCSGEVAAALSGLLRLNSAAQRSSRRRRGQHMSFTAADPRLISSQASWQAIIITSYGRVCDLLSVK